MTIVTGIVIMTLCLIVAWYLGKKDSYDKISFKESIDLLELPVITFTNNDIKLNFILDTGANRSIIDKEAIKLCQYTETNGVNNLSGLDGIQREVPNVSIFLGYNSHIFSCLLQVSDMSGIFGQMKQASGVNIHGILGNDFFTTYKYVLDFDTMVAYSKKRV